MLRATLQSNGENLVKGLDNLLDDLERGKGQLSIRQSADAFKIGENIATTPGKVIFRNELLELLQYDPTTAEVYERPLLIFPPWINKFYIMDLRPENSFIKWLVEQGYTVFVASWVNPDRRLAQKSFEDYMREGIFAALDAVEQATGVRDPNVVGYCIGGTLLTATLGYMAAKDDTRIHSATFWAAQADFSEAGDLTVFVDDAQLEVAAAADGACRRRARRLQDGDDLQHAARQRSDLVVRDQQLHARQAADAVRPALLEFRHDAHAGEDASVLSARMLQGQQSGQGQDGAGRREDRSLEGEDSRSICSPRRKTTSRPIARSSRPPSCSRARSASSSPAAAISPA